MNRTLRQLAEQQEPAGQVAASGGELLSLLDHWVQRGWLRALDRAFAAFVLEQAPGAPASVILAAALTSLQLGRGHACLDLAALLRDPDTGLAAAGEGEAGQPALLRAGLPAGLSLQQWRQALADCALVEDRDSRARHPERPLVLAGQRLYLRRYWNHEQTIARVLSERLLQPGQPPERLAQRLGQLFPVPFVVSGERQADWQKIACAIAARGRFSVITGGPGTGKTTSVVRLLGLLQASAMDAGKALRMRLAAPTGKAAARLSESIGRAISELQVSDAVRQAIPAEVGTLHRLLGSRPDTRHFIHHAGNPLALDVLVVDEASMIDLEMMACLLDALPAGARLILLGDKDQLASVDAGAVLGDLCQGAETGRYSQPTLDWLARETGETLPATERQAADAAPDALAEQTVMLRYSRRFDASQGIGRLARLVNDKQAAAARALLDSQPEQLFDLRLQAGQAQLLADLFVEGHPQARGTPPGYRHYLDCLHASRPAAGLPPGDEAWSDWAGRVLQAFDAFRLLCALRQGPWGVEGLNLQVAAQLRQAGLISHEQGWYEGRPVLVTRNDYSLGLMNGDIGIALELPAAGGGSALRVAFARNDGSGGVRFVLPSRLAEVETVYAMTVHKSQGSEFAHTALVLPAAASPVLTKELLYTAITRAKHWFSLVESGPGVFEGAVGKNVQRVSGLALQLRAELDRTALG